MTTIAARCRWAKLQGFRYVRVAGAQLAPWVICKHGDGVCFARNLVVCLGVPMYRIHLTLASWNPLSSWLVLPCIIV